MLSGLQVHGNFVAMDQRSAQVKTGEWGVERCRVLGLPGSQRNEA